MRPASSLRRSPRPGHPQRLTAGTTSQVVTTRGRSAIGRALPCGAVLLVAMGLVVVRSAGQCQPAPGARAVGGSSEKLGVLRGARAEGLCAALAVVAPVGAPPGPADVAPAAVIGVAVPTMNGGSEPLLAALPLVSGVGCAALRASAPAGVTAVGAVLGLLAQPHPRPIVAEVSAGCLATLRAPAAPEVRGAASVLHVFPLRGLLVWAL